MNAHERKTPYERWMEREGVPILEGYGVRDLRNIHLGEWERLGCKGAYIQLRGLEGITGLYGFEIPPGKSLNPERHLYEKIICVLSGKGYTEIEFDGLPTRSFDWREGSLFSPPLNIRHRLINTGNKPALFMAVTTAPMIFDNFHNDHFIFNCNYVFTDRYNGQEGYFAPNERRYRGTSGKEWIMETNFIPDVHSVPIDPQEQKGLGVNLTQFEISENTLIGHLAEWPVGCYHKAHYHGGGAVLLILRSKGYSLMWPNEWGPRPYESGYGKRVVRVDWIPGSVFCPPTGWFHQHFNTGPEPALQLALRCGSQKFPLGIRISHIRAGVYTSVKEGGTLIEYEDEDPAIKHVYEESLKPKGISSKMASRTGRQI